MTVGWRVALGFLFGLGAYASTDSSMYLGIALTAIAGGFLVSAVIEAANVIDDHRKNRGNVSQ